MFTRINDLKQHVMTAHRSTYSFLPGTFFTAGTGFYLGVHPDDYRRIAIPADYDKEECFEARKAVLRWCSSQLNAVKVTQEWRSGWLKAKAAERPALESCRTVKYQTETETTDIGKDPEVYLEEPTPLKKRKMDDSGCVSESESMANPLHQETKTTEYIEKEFTAEKYDKEETGDIAIQETGDIATQEGEMEKVTTEKSIQDRARELLKYGAMPFCAPARRDWTKGGLLSLEIDGKTLSWPPLDWQKLSADQRLLAVEFVAMSIEFQATGTFCDISRHNLLDKYNFLVLPGSAKLRIAKEEKIDHKTRFYNYQKLRRIANSLSHSKEEESWLNIFEKAKMDKSNADRLIEAIEVLHIPLRL